MCEEHEKAIKVANEFLAVRDVFTLEDIVEELKEKAGTTYLSPEYHIKDFLNAQIIEGRLRRIGIFYVKPAILKRK